MGSYFGDGLVDCGAQHLGFLSAWTHSPTAFPSPWLLAYQTPSMRPEGSACFSFSLECVHLMETSRCLEFLLEVEIEPSTGTQNTHYFKDYRRKFLSFYRGLYHKGSKDQSIERLQGHVYRSTEFCPALQRVIMNLAKVGFRDVKPLDLAALQGSEDSDDALSTRDHGGCTSILSRLFAFKRFVDNVVLGLSNGLQDALMSGPELDSSDVHETCTRLVAESPNAEEESCRMRKSLLLCQEELYNEIR